GEAGCQNYRTVQCAYHFKRGDVPRILGKPVAAVGSMLGSQEPGFHQLLEDLRKQRERDLVRAGDLFGADAHLAVYSQMFQSDETVVCLNRELEHDRAMPDQFGPSEIMHLRG